MKKHAAPALEGAIMNRLQEQRLLRPKLTCKPILMGEDSPPAPAGRELLYCANCIAGNVKQKIGEGRLTTMF